MTVTEEEGSLKKLEYQGYAVKKKGSKSFAVVENFLRRERSIQVGDKFMFWGYKEMIKVTKRRIYSRV